MHNFRASSFIKYRAFGDTTLARIIHDKNIFLKIHCRFSLPCITLLTITIMNDKIARQIRLKATRIKEYDCMKILGVVYDT